jgi:hypothetical protein
MTSTIQTFKVIVHAELSGEKLEHFGCRQFHLAAAAGDPATLAAVLDADSLCPRPAGAVLVFDQISNSGGGTYNT